MRQESNSTDESNQARSRLLKKFGKWVCQCLIALLCVTFVGAWYAGGLLSQPSNCQIGDPPKDFPAISVAFQSASGANVAAWYRPAVGSPATVILAHSLRGSRTTMLPRAKMLWRNGFSVLLFDFQAHGETPGTRITAGYLESYDLAAAVDFIKRNSPNEKIVVVGRSLGAASTILANPDIDAAILESAYTTIEQAIDNRIALHLGKLAFFRHVLTPLLTMQIQHRLGVSPAQMRPIHRIEKIQFPVMILAGEKDRHTTIEESKALFDAANEPEQFCSFAGAGHVDFYDFAPQQYETLAIEFLQKELKVGSNLSD